MKTTPKYSPFTRILRKKKRMPTAPDHIPDLQAVILSDLHFSDNRHADNSILPLASAEDELAETITRQVIGRKPDVFIMTGDNTNNGRESEVLALLPYLQRIRAAGIHVICIPGNHDLSQMDKETWRKYYHPLCTITSMDTDTLSYSAVINNVRILAMDDCSYSHGDHGEFPVPTLRRLRRGLAENPGYQPVIFLSHYSVLTGVSHPRDDRYRIQNPRLPGILRNAHVRLCFSGHQHSRNILEEHGMYEIISGTPLAYPHTLGVLKVLGNHASYYTEPIDFERYGPEHFAEKVNELDQAHDASLAEIFHRIISRTCNAEDEIRGIAALLLSVLNACQGGTLYEQLPEIQGSPYYEKMLQAMESTNYGPRLKELFRTTVRSCCKLDITLD